MNLHRGNGAGTQAAGPQNAPQNATPAGSSAGWSAGPPNATPAMSSGGRSAGPQNASLNATKYIPRYRFCRYDAAVIVLVVLIAAGVAFQLFNTTRSTLTADSHLEAVLTVEGEEVWRTNLSDAAAQQTRQTHKVTLNAGSITVTAESGKVSISASDCPDQICVHTGSLSSAGQSAVCLPFKAVLKVISVDSNGSITQDTSALYDAISK